MFRIEGAWQVFRSRLLAQGLGSLVENREMLVVHKQEAALPYRRLLDHAARFICSIDFVTVGADKESSRVARRVNAKTAHLAAQLARRNETGLRFGDT